MEQSRVRVIERDHVVYTTIFQFLFCSGFTGVRRKQDLQPYVPMSTLPLRRASTAIAETGKKRTDLVNISVSQRTAQLLGRHAEHREAFKLILVLIIGIGLGHFGTWARFSSTQPRYQGAVLLSKGSIQELSEIPTRNTSHIDKATGKSISKQQIIDPFVIPHLAGFSVATILPGQTVDSHQHQSMHEFFFILEGKAVFVIDGRKVEVEPGTFIHVAPHEKHGIHVPASHGAMKMYVSGVTID